MRSKRVGRQRTEDGREGGRESEGRGVEDGGSHGRGLKEARGGRRREGLEDRKEDWRKEDGEDIVFEGGGLEEEEGSEGRRS